MKENNCPKCNHEMDCFIDIDEKEYFRCILCRQRFEKMEDLI